MRFLGEHFSEEDSEDSEEEDLCRLCGQEGTITTLQVLSSLHLCVFVSVVLSVSPITDVTNEKVSKRIYFGNCSHFTE